MRATYRVLMATAFLLLPAFLISSCDDKNATPVGPSDDPAISDIGSPSFTTVGFGSKWHDPHIKGPKVRTFANETLNEHSTVFGCEADAKRFGSEDGAELRVTLTHDLTSTELVSEEDACAAGVYPVDQKIRGKLLTAVKELDFSYAGGNEDGAPVMRIPIDCNAEVAGIAEECTTDGTMDAYAYIFARTCHDGDANVGVVNAEDSEDCIVNYRGYPYYDWHAFVDAHSGGRVARKVRTFVIVDGEAVEGELVDARTNVILTPAFQLDGVEEITSHYLVWMVDVR